MNRRITKSPISAGNAVEIDKARINYTLSALEEDILTLLSIRPSYGLEISKAIEKASKGARIISIGSLYPSLRRLEEKKLVTSYWDVNESESGKRRGGARRRYYKIEDSGLRILKENTEIRDNLLQWQPV